MSEPAFNISNSKPCTKEEYEEQNKKIRQAFDDYFRPVTGVRPPLGGCSSMSKPKNK